MWNWQAIGAIGEAVGAMAVVATLLYLAKDIRQNSRSLAVSALRDTTAQWNKWSEMLACSADLADIVERGNRGCDSLRPSEVLRYDAYVQAFFDNVDSSRSLAEQQRMEDDLEVLTAIVARRIVIPGFAAWWARNTADYADDFVDWIERIRAGVSSEAR